MLTAIFIVFLLSFIPSIRKATHKILDFIGRAYSWVEANVYDIIGIVIFCVLLCFLF